MISMIRNATPLLMAVLLGIAVYSVMLAQQSAAERDLAQERVEYLTRTMAWQQDQIGVLHSALGHRDEQMQDDQEHIDASREVAEALERDDDEVAEWADGLVPGPIDEWLRKLRASAGDTDTDSARLPDKPATSAHQND